MIAITKGQKVFNVFNVIFMLVLAFITVYPFYYVAVASFSNASDFMMFRGFLYKPLGFTTGAYEYVFRDDRILRGFVNTMALILTRVTLAMLLTIVGAYVLSRKRTVWAPVFMFVIVVTMFFSGGMIPTYLNVRMLGLDNTFGALVLPSVINTFNMIIMRNAFEAVPQDIEEAASIDGATDFQVLTRIFLPLSFSSLATLSLFYAVGKWNSFNDALYYITSRDLQPLQLKLYNLIKGSQSVEVAVTEGSSNDLSTSVSESIQSATIIFATLPILIVYPFVQRYFVAGVTMGAVKG